MSLLSKLKIIFKVARRPFLRNSTCSLKHFQCGLQVRQLSMFPKFKVSEETFKTKDNMPDHFSLIYRSRLSNYLLTAQILSLTSVVIVGICVIYADLADYTPMATWKEQPVPVDNELLIYMSVLLIMSATMQYLLKKMPIRIYNYKDEKFVFVYYGAAPLSTKKFSCKIEEIKKLTERPNTILPWTNSRYEAHKNYGIILIEEHFKSVAELNIMLQLQKRYIEPVDPEHDL